MTVEPIRYAESDGLQLAYQVVGGGPIDLVMVTEWATPLEERWNVPAIRGRLERLASFARVISFDKRGIGLSDRGGVDDISTPEVWVRDLVAVMDAVGVEHPVLFGAHEGGPIAVLCAASMPGRIEALTLVNTGPRLVQDIAYPYGFSPEEWRPDIEGIRELWSSGGGGENHITMSSTDPWWRDWYGRSRRQQASPATGLRLMQMLGGLDARRFAEAVRVPTLIVHREDNRWWEVGHARWMADTIPGAELVVLPWSPGRISASVNGVGIGSRGSTTSGTSGWSRTERRLTRSGARQRERSTISATSPEERISHAPFDLREGRCARSARPVAAVPVAAAATTGGDTESSVEAFDTATIGIETGSLDQDGSLSGSTDVEIQWFADYTDVVYWEVDGPDGTPVFAGSLAGPAAVQTASELTFASRPNHPYDPNTYPGETLESFFERYPEGEYTFTGTTDDGSVVRSTAHLTHDLPAHPDVRVSANQRRVRMSWAPIGECFAETGCEELDVVEYGVKLSNEDTLRDDFVDGAFTNGDSRFTETYYRAEQICGPRRCRVELTADFFEPGESYEVQVFAIEASGNSTYRELQLDFPG